MKDFQNGVLIGNVVIHPSVLREFLKKSFYFGSYNPEKETLTLSANHGNGGEVLFELRNVSYESAKKLMEGLGLKKDGISPISWSKWNPVVRLANDGSEDAIKLRREMLELGVPFTEHECKSGEWAWFSHPDKYAPPLWTAEAVLEKIRLTAELYKEDLSTTP